MKTTGDQHLFFMKTFSNTKIFVSLAITVMVMFSSASPVNAKAESSAENTECPASDPLVNGYFQSNINSWTIYPASGGGTATFISNYTDSENDSRSGLIRLYKTQYGDGDRMNIRQSVYLCSGTYTVSVGWLNLITYQGNNEIQVTDDPYGSYSQSSGSLGHFSTFTTSEYSFTITTSGNYLIHVVPGHDQSGNSDAYIDSISLSRTGGWVPTQNNLILINQPDALSTYPDIRGNGYTVVVVDSGINASHPKFANKILYQYDYVNNDSTAQDDGDGHGTAVASIIVDVCPECKLVILKIGSDGWDPSHSGRIESALRWVIENRANYNIVAVNLSQGDQTLFNIGQTFSIFHDEIATLSNANVSFVAPSGNGFFLPHLGVQGATYPASDTYAIGVGAVFDSNMGSYSDGSGASATTSAADVIAPFSDRHTDLVPVFAPGVNIVVADASGSGTTTVSGTSFAAPHVTGAIALIQNRSKVFRGTYLTTARIKELLNTTGANIVDGDDENDNVTNTNNTFKRLDVLAAMNEVQALKGVNILGDPNMEADPGIGEDQWFMGETNGEWGRVHIYPADVIGQLLYGTAQCGTGYQAIGKKIDPFTVFGTPTQYYTSMVNQFDWPGGPMYYRFSVRSRNNFSASSTAHIRVYLVKMSDSSSLSIADSVLVTEWSWRDIFGQVGSGNIDAGFYRLYIEMAPNSDPDDTIFVDNFAISDQPPVRPCDPPSGTPTPTPTGTITPSATPNIPAPTPISLTNCNFEAAKTGWIFSGNSYVALAGGPVGPQYGVAKSDVRPSIANNFTIPTTANTFIQIFARGNLWIQLRNMNTNGVIDLYPPTFAPVYTDWTQLTFKTLLGSGPYRLELNAYDAYGSGLATADYDGLSISINGIVNSSCNSTPTPGPTSFVTPSATPTGTPHTPTNTPTSPPPTATRTPQPTTTPQATYTPQPSSTPQPTHTQSGANQTATAQGTTVPTYTPNPTYTPRPPDVDCPGCNVPQQPPPSPEMDCIRPIMFWEVAQWVDYSRCEIIKFFSWSEVNTQQLIVAGAYANTLEPFGTFHEFYQATDAFLGLWESYNWINTGFTGVGTYTRPDIVTVARRALSGDIDLDINSTNNSAFYAAYTQEILFCQLKFEDIFSTRVSEGVCVIWSLLFMTGIQQWIQFFFDLACYALLFRGIFTFMKG